MATVVEIDPDRPGRLPKPRFLLDGAPYGTIPSARAGQKPVAVGRVVPPTPVRPSPAGDLPAPLSDGVAVVFEFGRHTMRSTFAEVSVSKGGTHLVFDLTGRPDAFTPFFGHVDRYEPTDERVVAVPQGGRTAYYLAVEHHPPVAVVIAGRKLYAVPILETAEVESDTLVQLQTAVLPTQTLPAALGEKEEEHVGNDQDGYDRESDAAGPDGGAGADPAAGSEDGSVELRLDTDDVDERPHHRSPVLG